ncbi:MAG: aminotransferase class I/II-fold pyridoxal phosphate-dependent enzyme [Thermomicrobiales bacterium]|nr:aminotransferase class I/II-fold pyridoxal phosphate-dependent enzyme [Thermomicrobiales bacterium]
MVVNFDEITAESMAGTHGAKWTTWPDCIGAFVAEMDFGTAPAVKDALKEVVDAGYFGYLPKQEDDHLIDALCKWYGRHTDWNVSPDMVRSMPDVLTGMEIVLTRFSPKGGKVILPTPAYMPFVFLPTVLGREIIEVPMLQTGYGWEYDYAAIDQAFQDGGEVLIVCNPYNPIGKVHSAEEMAKLGEIVDRYDGRVFSDEIHAPLVYSGQRHIPYASVNEVNAKHTITSIAASKAWNLPGLKCAQIVLSNPDDIDNWQTSGAAWRAHGASGLGVVASAAAYNDGEDWLNDVLAYLEGNRDALAVLIEEHLPGVKMIKPQGTYLAWLDFTETKVPEDVATFFREHAQVAITDGSACGEVGKRHVRFNFALARPVMTEAIARMGKAMADL